MISPLSTEYPTPVASWMGHRFAQIATDLNLFCCLPFKLIPQLSQKSIGSLSTRLSVLSFNMWILGVIFHLWQHYSVKSDFDRFSVFCHLSSDNRAFSLNCTSISQISATLDAIRSKTSLRTPMRNMSGNIQSRSSRHVLPSTLFLRS